MFRSALVRRAIATILLGALAAGCAPGLAVSYATLTGVEKTIALAADTFPEYSEQKQRAMLETAKSHAEYTAAVTAFRAKREQAIKAIEGAQACVQLARDGIADVRAGVKSPKDLATWIAAAMHAAADVQQVLSAFGFELGK